MAEAPPDPVPASGDVVVGADVVVVTEVVEVVEVVDDVEESVLFPLEPQAPVNALSAIAAATPAVTLRRRCFRLTVMVTTRFL